MARNDSARQPATDTRTRILEAAAARFAAGGYHGTAYAELIADSGLSKGAFYHYFRSKQDLAAAVFERKQAAVVAAMEAAVAGVASPWERLVTALRVRARLFASDATLQCLPRLSTDFARVPALAPQIAASNQVPIRWFRDLLEQARASGEIRNDVDLALVGRVLFGALVGVNELSQRESSGKDHVRRNEEILVLLETLLRASSGSPAPIERRLSSHTKREE